MATTDDAAILFDIDGTLVDSTYHHALAWQRAFARHEVVLPLWRIHRTVGMGGDKLVAEVAGEDVEERIGDALRDAWREEYVAIKAEVDPLPGAAELVRALADAGFTVALASSGDPEFADEALDDLDIRDQVALLTTSEDAEESKPEPDLIGVTLDGLEGIRRAVMIGDTPYDVESAERAGLGCIGLRSGGYSKAELVDAGAVLVVDAPEDLRGIEWEKYLRAR
jgi:HAD superfamily hydrolase (TIGR01549 family)